MYMCGGESVASGLHVCHVCLSECLFCVFERRLIKTGVVVSGTKYYQALSTR